MKEQKMKEQKIKEQKIKENKKYRLEEIKSNRNIELIFKNKIIWWVLLDE